MIDIATFDPLPIEGIWLIFSFPSREAFSDAFDSSGYNYQYAFENFGTATIVIHVSLFLALACLLIFKLKTNLVQRV